MIDFYRKSILSQLGKDAGNLSISEFTKKTEETYNSYLSQLRELKEKLKNRKNDFGLYL